MTNIIHWNVGYNAKMDLVYKELEKHIGQCFIGILLEITPDHKNELVNLLGEKCNFEYSLDYRKPGKFDGKNRKLGVLFICSKDFMITEAGVFNRTLFPDRTLYIKLKINNEEIKVVGFHSITGCSHKTAKSTNFLSMAEAIDEFQPDILTMDANEPKVDHYELSQMKFFDDNGRGAKVFFNELNDIGLNDTFLKNYPIEEFVPGNPLSVSHKINGSKSCRYDFIFCRPEKYDVNNVIYNYDDAVLASADHAILISQGDIF